MIHYEFVSIRMPSKHCLRWFLMLFYKCSISITTIAADRVDKTLYKDGNLTVRLFNRSASLVGRLLKWCMKRLRQIVAGKTPRVVRETLQWMGETIQWVRRLSNELLEYPMDSIQWVTRISNELPMRLSDGPISYPWIRYEQWTIRMIFIWRSSASIFFKPFFDIFKRHNNGPCVPYIVHMLYIVHVRPASNFLRTLLRNFFCEEFQPKTAVHICATYELHGVAEKLQRVAGQIGSDREKIDKKPCVHPSGLPRQCSIPKLTS